ncbi:MAG: PEP-CTERM sorting domain-containing protein [Planctomycetota bacterium]
MNIKFGALAMLCFAASQTHAQSILFVRGAERSGGFLEAGNDSSRTEQLADIENTNTNSGNHGWATLATTLESEGFSVAQIIEPLELNAPSSGQTTGSGIEFTFAQLSAFDAVVFGSNNGVYSQTSITAVDQFVRGGGGAVFISDANFGSNWGDAPNSDQQFLDNYGITVHQDRGTYSLLRSEGEYNDPTGILLGIDQFDGEGVSPFDISNIDDDVTLLATVGVPDGQQVRLNDSFGQGSSRQADDDDVAFFAASVGQGRLVGHFDRNTFFNLNGAGTNITRFDNSEFAIDLFRFATTTATAIPEPSPAIGLALTATAWFSRRQKRPV